MKILRMSIVFVLILLFFGQVAAQDDDREGVSAFVKENSTASIVDSFMTIDGLYRAEVSVYECVAVGDMQIASVDMLEIIEQETETVVFSTEQVISCGGLGTYGHDLIGWINGDLYYTKDREGEVHGSSLGFRPVMYRVSLDILGEETLGRSAFSPLRNFRVSWQHDGTVVEIHTVATGEVVSANLAEALLVTDVVWLPDESGLMVIQGEAGQPFSTFAVVTYMSIDAQSQSILVDSRNS